MKMKKQVRSARKELIKDVLSNVNEITLEQKSELVHLETFLSSEQKWQKIFIIRNDQQQQILSATVQTVFCLRVGVGTIQHPIYDIKMLHSTFTEEDSMQLYRSLRCDGCCCPISLQMLEIYAPFKNKLNLIGTIEQQFNLFYAVFHIKNPNKEILLKIVAQDIHMCMFKILTAYGLEVGCIYRKSVFDGDVIEEYSPLCLQYNENLQNEHRLMLLAATLLIDCMYEKLPNFLKKKLISVK